jgi:hypothetical protein
VELIIEGTPRPFTDIKAFRAHHQLPDTFGVVLFEPKDYSGLARIDRAGVELNRVRDALLDAIPKHLSLAEFWEKSHLLSRIFHTQLKAINEQVGLRDVEIEYAVSGFDDMCQTLLYALLQAKATRTEPPSFATIYGGWLNNSVRVSTTVHPYTHHGTNWQVHIVNHAYGRIGLIIDTDTQTYYVRDVRLACPAEGFMYTLLHDVTSKIFELLTQ